MNLLQKILSCSIAISGIAIAPNVANGVTFDSLPGYKDANFQADLANGRFIEDFVAESRIGDRAGFATYEVDIQEIDLPLNITVVKQEQFNWPNNREVDFQLRFTKATGQFEYSVGGTTLAATNLRDLATVPQINAIFARTRSTVNSSIEIKNLVVNGISYAGSLISSGADNINFLKIADLSEDFTISGQSLMIWSGAAPLNSFLAAQFKVGFIPNVKVPESTSISLLSIAFLGLTLTLNKNYSYKNHNS
jgi:hypothetical protein